MLEQPAASEEMVPESETGMESIRRMVGLVLGPVVALLIYWFTSGKLAPDAHRLAALLGLVLVFWVTEAVPLPVTALLGAALCVVCGVASAKVVFAPFAHPLIFLFVGSFMIARAMVLHQLDKRFALAILSLSWLKASPRRILLVMGIVSAAMSMWISNTASTAMMLPIAVGLLRAIHETRTEGNSGSSSLSSWSYGTGLMLMIAYSASAGGIATPVGTPPNLIAIGMLQELAGVQFTFFHWMAMALPLVVLMLVYLFGLLCVLHPVGAKRLSGLHHYIQVNRLGSWTPGQRNTLIAFSFAVFFWLLPGAVSVILGSDSGTYQWLHGKMPEAVTAVLAMVLLFILPTRWSRREFTLDWRQAVDIDWGTILLFGGGLSFGSLMFSTGLAEVLGQAMMRITGSTGVWGVTAASIAMGILISEAASNTASANMVIPVVIALAQTAGLDPVPPAIGACLGASYGFMLPVSTPPNAIVYGSGMVPIRKMIRAGILFDMGGFLIIFTGLRILYPVLGG